MYECAICGEEIKGRHNQIVCRDENGAIVVDFYEGGASPRVLNYCKECWPKTIEAIYKELVKQGLIAEKV